MKSALQSLMPAHSSILEIAAEHVALERAAQADPIFALQGQPQLVAIAQLDRDPALTLKRLLNQLEEGDFSEASSTSDELSHRIRTHYLASLSDAAGVVKH